MSRTWSTRRDPHRVLEIAASPQRGEDVEHLQASINERGRTRGVAPVSVDGIMGPDTFHAAKRVGYLLGALTGTTRKPHLTVGLQRMIVSPETRSVVQRARAKARRKEIKPAPGNALWHPDAIRVPHQDAGAFTGGGRKLVWHTTEGTSLPNYQGSAPHFTIDPRTGRLWQHMPINRAARTLKAGGPNFWNTIQVEIIGSAKDSPNWSRGDYANLAELARWIERNAGVPRRCDVTFTDSARVSRLSGAGFKSYAGHIGHQHAPGNDHWDPGRFKIALVLA